MQLLFIECSTGIQISFRRDHYIYCDMYLDWHGKQF